MSTGTPADDSAASSTATRHRGVIRSFFYWLCFSSDRRYQMFQTIVGTTIANLVAAGVIAGIAVASGALSISFYWSWSGYWHDVTSHGLPFAVGLTVTGVLVNLGAVRRQARRRGWLKVLGVIVLVFVIAMFGYAFVRNFFTALSISFHHVHSGPAAVAVRPD